MQIIFEDEDEGEHGRGIDTVGLVICIGGIGRCLEGKRDGRNRSRRGRV